MNIFTWTKNKILKYLGVDRLTGTPNDNRLTYINDDEAIFINKIRSYKVWFYGDGDELLNWYTNQETYGWATNPIYNRNNRNFFWGLSSLECDIKRVHSGLPKAIVDTICNIVGKPTITCEDPRLAKILKVNDYMFRLTQQIRPLSLVEGDGCLKWNINVELSDVPLMEYYEAEDWNPIIKSGILVGLVFKTYYRDQQNENYILFETRSYDERGTMIEYNLYRLGKKNELIEVRDFERIPEIASLGKEPKKLIPGIKKLFAMPVKYYYNALRKERGKSIYDGKLDLFDMYDEIWSQASQTNRVSTPVEYFDVDMLQRTQDGVPILPKKYNRQFIAKNGTLNGDGETGNDGIKTTQPDLNFDKYGMLAADVLNTILVGVLSPSSMGIDISRKDNADAQREKEKQSIFTRDTIIDKETDCNKEFLLQGLMLQDYMDLGEFIKDDYEISIKYDEFANPSFESELQVLGPAWNQGQISTKQYVKLLWAGKLSEEELLAEEQYLEENKSKDDIDMEALLNEGPNRPHLPEATEEEERAPEFKK